MPPEKSKRASSASKPETDTPNGSTTLTQNDTVWLSLLADKPIDDAWLEEANLIIEIGSANLNFHRARSVVTRIKSARNTFFGEMLGWATEGHPFNATFERFKEQRPALGPISQFIGTQRFIAQHGLDVGKIIRQNRAILSKSASDVEEKLENISSYGLKAANVVNSAPTVIHLSVAHLDEKIANLKELGIEPAKAIKGNPQLLTMAPESVREKVDNINQQGVDAAKVILSKPGVLRLAPATVREKIDNLRKHGLDPSWVFTYVATQSPKTVDFKINYIQRLARVFGWQENVIDFINDYPNIMVFSLAKIRAHARLLAEHGGTDLTREEIAGLLRLPLASHIISLSQGDEYRPQSVEKVNSQLSAKERDDKISELLEDRPGLETMIGHKVVREYLRYQAG
jgi:hypothetical protein